MSLETELFEVQNLIGERQSDAEIYASDAKTLGGVLGIIAEGHNMKKTDLFAEGEKGITYADQITGRKSRGIPSLRRQLREAYEKHGITKMAYKAGLSLINKFRGYIKEAAEFLERFYLPLQTEAYEAEKSKIDEKGKQLESLKGNVARTKRKLIYIS